MCAGKNKLQQGLVEGDLRIMMAVWRRSRKCQEEWTEYSDTVS